MDDPNEFPGEPVKSIPVKAVSEPWPTPAEFRSLFLSGTPLLLKGYCKSYPAASWTLQSLRERAGDADVDVRKNVHLQDYRTGKKYNIETMKFRQYIDQLVDTRERKVAKAQQYYLAVQNIKHVFPMLKDDVPPSPYVEKVHMGPYLWMAAPGHYEFCHFDPDDGFLCVFTGHKRVRLYSYKYVKELYPNHRGTKGRTVQSQVDCGKPDFEEHPDFRNVVCEIAEVCPGDALFIPAFYWHQVTSTELSISVNYFWGDAGENVFTQKLLDTRKEAMMYWLLNIIEQNRKKEVFPRYLAHLNHVLHNFLWKQWHDNIDDKQTAIIREAIRTYLGLEDFPKAEEYPPLGRATTMKIRGLVWRD